MAACRRHPREPCVMVCSTCKNCRFVCRECIANEHRGHTIDKFETVAEGLLGVLRKEKAKKLPVLKAAQLYLNDCATVKDNERRVAENTRRLIQKKRDILKRAIDEASEILLQQHDACVSNIFQFLSDYEQQVDESVKKILEFQNDLAHIEKSSNYKYIIEACQKVSIPENPVRFELPPFKRITLKQSNIVDRKYIRQLLGEVLEEDLEKAYLHTPVNQIVKQESDADSVHSEDMFGSNQTSSESKENISIGMNTAGASAVSGNGQYSQMKPNIQRKEDVIVDIFRNTQNLSRTGVMSSLKGTKKKRNSPGENAVIQQSSITPSLGVYGSSNTTDLPTRYSLYETDRLALNVRQSLEETMPKLPVAHTQKQFSAEEENFAQTANDNSTTSSAFQRSPVSTSMCTGAGVWSRRTSSKVASLDEAGVILSTFQHSTSLPTAITFSDSDHCWFIHNNGNDIKLINKSGVVKKTITVSESKHILGMASTHDGSLLICCPYAKCIKQLCKPDFHAIEVFRRDMLIPVGICVTSTGDVLLTLIDKWSYENSERNERVLVKCNSKWKITAKAQYSKDGRNLFVLPYKVCVNKSGSLVAVINQTSDMSSRLVMLDQDFTVVLQCIGHENVILGDQPFVHSSERFNVMDVKFDNNDNLVIIEDYTGTIQILDPVTCRPVRILLREQGRPRTLSVNNNIIWVGFQDGRIKCLKY